ncbi:hypothetical protein [Variovorax sp. YR752]|uniref:hypothetical protein n=1 Tax=Variovorax sp. YR752 TaxID=1884383 RepID=UPI00313833D5
MTTRNPRSQGSAAVMRAASGKVLLWVVLASAGLTARESPAAERVRTTAGADRNTARLLSLAVPPTQEQPSEPVYTVQLGASFDRASDGERTLSLPFLVSYAPNRWYFEVSGDGYQRVKSGVERSRGLADIALVVNYTKTFGSSGQYGIVPELELDLPTHGEVGSSRMSQVLRLTLSGAFGPWGLDMAGAVSRDGETPEADVSRYSRSVAAKVSYEWKRNMLAALQVKRVTQSGAPGKTVWRGEFDYPIKAKLTGIVSLGYSHADSSTRSIGFDLAYAF